MRDLSLWTLLLLVVTSSCTCSGGFVSVGVGNCYFHHHRHRGFVISPPKDAGADVDANISYLSMTTGKAKNFNTNGKNVFEKGRKGKILVLGGSGFLGGNIARRAILEGYSVTSLSRGGKPESRGKGSGKKQQQDMDGANGYGIDYRRGDARESGIVESILDEGGYVAVFHCIGLLFDGESGIRSLNKFVSGSGSVPEPSSTYDDITRVTAFNAISAAEKYAKARGRKGDVDVSQSEPLPFIFTSAAEAGWPDVSGGSFVERTLAPRWLKRYLQAKRAVEARLMNGEDGNTGQQTLLRPVIFRPSLIYSLDRLASLPPVGAFFVGNRAGLPFVDRPVSVQTLSTAAVRSISNTNIRGVLRFKEIDKLSK